MRLRNQAKLRARQSSEKTRQVELGYADKRRPLRPAGPIATLDSRSAPEARVNRLMMERYGWCRNAPTQAPGRISRQPTAPVPSQTPQVRVRRWPWTAKVVRSDWRWRFWLERRNHSNTKPASSRRFEG